MAINLTGGLPPEILGQQQQLNRQQQMAQMLMQQGQQMPQGQMVSGRYVQPSIFAQLAPLAQMYAGQKIAERGDKQALDLAKQLREGQGEALANYIGQSQGRPAVPEKVTEMAGPYGVSGAGQNIPMPTATVAGRPEIKADPLLASMNALQNPYAPEFLRQQAIKNLIPEEITMPEGSSRVVRNPDGTYREVATGPAKTSPEYKNFLIAQADPINPFKGGFTDYQTMLKKAGASNVSVSTGQKGFDNTLKLRGDFRSEPVYKGFQEIESAFNQINSGLNAKSPAGDLAAATKFMKLLDPTSVVRESELSMAMQATGALDRLYNYANLVATGQKLTPTQREDFRKLGNEFYTTSYNQYNTKREEYSDIAKRNDLNVDDVVGKLPKAPAVTLPPVFAINQSTGERIQSTDGGNTWKPVPKGK
jgi:hypothetical protein